MDYALHPEVYGDLEEIHGYFDGFNPTRADHILDEFLDAFIWSHNSHTLATAAPILPPGHFDSKWFAIT
jgi:hypothetical protein